MELLEQLKVLNKLRQDKYPSGWDLPRWGNAVAGETGEMCNIIKKIDRGDFSLLEGKEKLADEAADIVCYLDLLCQCADIDLSMAITNKFNKVSERIGSELKIQYNP